MKLLFSAASKLAKISNVSDHLAFTVNTGENLTVTVFLLDLNVACFETETQFFAISNITFPDPKPVFEITTEETTASSSPAVNLIVPIFLATAFLATVSSTVDQTLETLTSAFPTGSSSSGSSFPLQAAKQAAVSSSNAQATICSVVHPSAGV